MLIGYMRVSTDANRQITDLQRDALIRVGVDEQHIFEDKASGFKDDRVGLAQALEYVKEGDVLVVWKLDRLGRSLPHLIEIVSQREWIHQAHPVNYYFMFLEHWHSLNGHLSRRELMPDWQQHEKEDVSVDDREQFLKKKWKSF